MLLTADLFIVAAASVLVAALAVGLWQPPTEPEWLEFRGPDGAERVALASAARVTVRGRIGVSEIEVRDRRARFIDGPCQNRVCIAAGWLSRSDEFAACVPNGVSIRMRTRDGGYDAVAY